jgi:hypothetical protein
MKQTILTFVTKVNPDRVSDLKELLDSIASDVEHNPLIPFADLNQLHFASLVLNDDPSYGADLVFENNFDGSLDPYLEDLYAHASAGLHSIYSCCRDYPAASGADKAQILSYLRAHVVRPNAYHIGNVGRSVERTHQEDALRDGLEGFLDDVVAQGNMGPGVHGESAAVRVGKKRSAATDRQRAFHAPAQPRYRSPNRAGVVAVVDSPRHLMGDHAALDREA